MENDLFAGSTRCSGGVISGNFFLMEDSDLGFEIAHIDVIKARSNYEKWKNFPVNKKKRFEVFYKACEGLVKALWKVRKAKGTDEAVFLLEHYSMLAWNLHNLLGDVYYSDPKLAQSTKFKDLRFELFRWSQGYGYDFFSTARV